MWKYIDTNIKCDSKHTYTEGKMLFFCCSPHAREEAEEDNKKKNKKLSKKDQS